MAVSRSSPSPRSCSPRRSSSCNQPDETKTVTAHFPRAVSVYKGTDVRVLGVNVGRVTAVIPEGNSVRVEMEYDADVDLPKDAKAVVVTPTLVADRFVQLTPGLLERADDEGRRGHRAARQRRPCRAGPHLRQHPGPRRGARPQRRQQGRHPQPPARGRRERARRPGPARQRDDPPALRGGGDVRRGRRAAVRHRHGAGPVHRHAGHQRQAGPGVREGPGRRLGVPGLRARRDPEGARRPWPTRWAR